MTAAPSVSADGAFPWWVPSGAHSSCTGSCGSTYLASLPNPSTYPGPSSRGIVDNSWSASSVWGCTRRLSDGGVSDRPGGGTTKEEHCSMAVGQHCEGCAHRRSGTGLTYCLASCGFGLRHASTCSTAGKSCCPSMSFGRNTPAPNSVCNCEDA